MSEYINLVGNPIDGFRVFGVYDSLQEATAAQEGIDQPVVAMDIEFADHFSVCTECDKHLNDAKGETKWSEHADPYCQECIVTQDNLIYNTFKCCECGTKYEHSFCSTDDVSICRWCSGEEAEAGILE